jgi:hypothetical protein
MLASKNACLVQQRSKYSIKNLKCKYFARLSKTYGTQKDNIAIVKKAGSEKTQQYLTRISGTICGRHTHTDQKAISARKADGAVALPTQCLTSTSEPRMHATGQRGTTTTR